MRKAKMIPYAGYDPTEADIEQIRRPFGRLHRRIEGKIKLKVPSERKIVRKPRDVLDGEACIQLYELGIPRAAIGIMMAQIFGRRSVYTVGSINGAIWRYKKAMNNDK